jgi:hypothetical protein
MGGAGPPQFMSLVVVQHTLRGLFTGTQESGPKELTRHEATNLFFLGLLGWLYTPL